jgi:hypothetical protein
VTGTSSTLIDALALLGRYDGYGQPIAEDALRIQCPVCDQFIVIAEAYVDERDGMTVYMCPYDREEFASVRGRREVSFYGASEVRHGRVWRIERIDRAD